MTTYYLILLHLYFRVNLQKMKPQFLLMVRIKHLYLVAYTFHIWLPFSQAKSHSIFWFITWTVCVKTSWRNIFWLGIMSINITSVINFIQSERTHTWVRISSIKKSSWLIKIFILIIQKERLWWFHFICLSIVLWFRLNLVNVNIKIVILIWLMLQVFLIHMMKNICRHT